MKWYTDGNVTTKTDGDTYTVDTTDFGIGVHTVTVRAKRNGKLYSELIEFTVTAEAEDDGGPTITGVTPDNLVDKLAEIDAETNSEDNPTTLVFEDFNISGTDWGSTIYSTMNNVTKYVVFDLSACHADSSQTDDTIDNTIKGGSNPTATAFNYMRARAAIIGIILPESLVAIGSYSVNKWTSLKSVTIPANVTSIGNYGFDGASGLTRITLLCNLKITTGMYFENGFKNFVENNYSDNRIGTYVWNGTEWSKVN